MVVAVVPVKRLSAAKQRLAPLFSPSERERICLAMLFDVLDALRATPEVGEICVLTSDPDLPCMLRSDYPGVRHIRDPKRSGLNGALRHAALELARCGASRMLIVPADLPLVTPGALEGVLGASEGASVLLVPDRSRRGTALLLLSPPIAILPRYGADSFARHLEGARTSGLRWAVRRGGHRLWDVDEPADFGPVLRYGQGTRTRARALELGIRRRLESVPRGDSRSSGAAARRAAMRGGGSR